MASLERGETRTLTNESTQQTADTVARRSFLKATAAAATALAGSAAGVAAAGSTAPDDQSKETGKGKLSGVVHARFDSTHPPKLADVHAVLGEVFRLHGCVTCGLLGIDVRLNAAGPAERLAKPDGVQAPVEVLLER
jgi:hypothetical protein